MPHLVNKESAQLKYQPIATPSWALIATVSGVALPWQWLAYMMCQGANKTSLSSSPANQAALITFQACLSSLTLSRSPSLSGLDTSLFSSPLLDAHPQPRFFPPLWLAETFAWSLHIFHFRSHYALVAPDRPPWLILMNWKSQLKVNFQPAPLHIHIHIQTNPASIVH